MIVLSWRGAVLLLAVAAPAWAGQIEIHWVSQRSNPGQVAIEVAGLEAEAIGGIRGENWNRERWQQLLSIHAEQGDVTTDLFVPAMLGTYAALENRVRFEPLFPLERGVRYRAVFRGERLPGGRGAEQALVSTFQLPAQPLKSTTYVAHVYPSSDELPENLLKFYVHFSAPMSRGNIYEHIHLREESGREVELPFLQIDEELWDSAMTRLTLFIDPGRIKRGVLPLEEVGPALESDKRYVLEIDRAWRDASGAPLRAKFEKKFRVGAPDRAPPDQTRWQLRSPGAGTHETLTIDFREPLDHALSLRMIAVTSGSGVVLKGKPALADAERQWQFTPEAPWERGPYEVVVQTTIEDLAGNNIGKPFEVDLFEGVQRRFSNSVVRLKFEAR